MKRGFTLVEQMIAVALLGLGAVAVDALAQHSERAALAELQRARAGVLLEYHADRVAKGLPAETEVVQRLSAALPGAKVERESKGDVVKLTATWLAPWGTGRRAVTVLGAKR